MEDLTHGGRHPVQMEACAGVRDVREERMNSPTFMKLGCEGAARELGRADRSALDHESG